MGLLGRSTDDFLIQGWYLVAAKEEFGVDLWS
jgi:hypothetical protein